MKVLSVIFFMCTVVTIMFGLVLVIPFTGSLMGDAEMGIVFFILSGAMLLIAVFTHFWAYRKFVFKEIIPGLIFGFIGTLIYGIAQFTPNLYCLGDCSGIGLFLIITSLIFIFLLLFIYKK